MVSSERGKAVALLRPHALYRWCWLLFGDGAECVSFDPLNRPIIGPVVEKWTVETKIYSR